jgi:hypothetical protein
MISAMDDHNENKERPATKDELARLRAAYPRERITAAVFLEKVESPAVDPQGTGLTTNPRTGERYPVDVYGKFRIQGRRGVVSVRID